MESMLMTDMKSGVTNDVTRRTQGNIGRRVYKLVRTNSGPIKLVQTTSLRVLQDTRQVANFSYDSIAPLHVTRMGDCSIMQ
jgi:hypothetical protein